MNKPPNQWRDAPVDATIVNAPKPQPRAAGRSDPVLRMVVPVDRSLWAIAAGYLGLISVIPIFGPFAVIASLIALFQIERSKATPTPKYGMGRAIFGLIMGLLGCVVLVLVFSALIASR